MVKLIIRGVLEIDDDIMYSKDDLVAKKWFFDEILRKESLVVHSNDIGDEIGLLQIQSIVED